MRRSGFTLVELAFVVGVLGVARALLLVGTQRSNADKRLRLCEQQLKHHARTSATSAAYAAYAADNRDALVNFSWRPGTIVRGVPGDLDPRFTNDDTEAHAKQAIFIIRRLHDDPAFPLAFGWLANSLYTHLVLTDYEQVRLPRRVDVCSDDITRRRWQSTRAFRQDAFAPAQPLPSPTNLRWSFSSSYLLTASHYSHSVRTAAGSTVGPGGSYSSLQSRLCPCAGASLVMSATPPARPWPSSSSRTTSACPSTTSATDAPPNSSSPLTCPCARSR